MPATSFDSHIADLTLTAFYVGAAAAVPGVAPRAWSIPGAYPVGVPLYDPTGFMTACYRADLNDLILQAYAGGAEPNGGRIGEVMAGKLALDHIACRERALHARHATPVRIKIWASARRAGHSDDELGVFGAFSAAVYDVYKAATAVSNSQL